MKTFEELRDSEAEAYALAQMRDDANPLLKAYCFEDFKAGADWGRDLMRRFQPVYSEILEERDSLRKEVEALRAAIEVYPDYDTGAGCKEQDEFLAEADRIRDEREKR